ncbi:MAG: hypothetical protein HYU03_04730 [Thaumarchaeota archaeon]|nr:hypothetical protein [Nitrososphaerota archaeon]
MRIVRLNMGHGHGVYIQAAINAAKRYDNIILETSGMPMHTKVKEAVKEVGRREWSSARTTHSSIIRWSFREFRWPDSRGRRWSERSTTTPLLVSSELRAVLIHSARINRYNPTEFGS